MEHFIFRLNTDRWGRKLYLKGHDEYNSSIVMVKASFYTNMSWKERTEAHLHTKMSHSPENVSKRWKTAGKRALNGRIKKWRFYNRIHDTQESHGFVTIPL